jgi:hypothetical protein
VEIVIIGKENGPTQKLDARNLWNQQHMNIIVEDLTNELKRRTMEAT